MIRNRTGFAFVVSVCLGSCAALIAQSDSPRGRLGLAHAQYYTPTASGLKSFSCDAAIDWKAMITRFSGTEIQDDNPTLQYLHSVHLSISDELRGAGSLEWSGGAEMPQGSEGPIGQIRHGLQTSVAGFFQSWNPYMNGSMVPFPGDSATVTSKGEGVHLSESAKETKVDEDFDKNMLLTQVVVENPAVRFSATPTFVSTPAGLVVSAVQSQINQPPSAPGINLTLHVEYAQTGAYQLPSHLLFDIKNAGIIELGLSNCQVNLAAWAQTPQGEVKLP